jgi:DNA gyrase subunit A
MQTDFARSVVKIKIDDEMKSSYLDYSMSVIIGRALPDVRDGLKPVHRRILFAMHQEGLLSSRKYSKCAGVVGEVLKKYHPHGDAPVYDALVRMAQPWNLRYPLVDGQGNFGSVDGDPPAAYRYTECRMTRLAEELLVDIEKQTVDFGPNFDGNVDEPDVLPSRFPNLLVNGADGIAVGMATKIPPHNLGEIIDACMAVIDRGDLSVDELMKIVPGPDFPTGGTILGRAGVREAYETGRGRVVCRGRVSQEEVHGRQAIIIDEIPYQVNKARLVEQVAELVKERKIEGIAALRDESDRHGMRVVIELKKDALYEVVLNNLYKHTQLQSTFGVILLSVVNKQPRLLSLLEMIKLFIGHRREVILRRTRFLLAEALARAHILEGFKKALDHLDEIIALIRRSQSPAEAREGLVALWGFTVIQADAILELRLQRLTGMERQKILEEYEAIQTRIGELREILASEKRLMEVVKGELVEIANEYRDDRRTKFSFDRSELTLHDLVAEEDQVVTLSHLGYIKRSLPSEWRMQRRGGFGKQGMTTREEDYVTSLFVANTHSLLLVFTTAGRVFPLPVVDVPEAGRNARGRPIVNLVPVPEGDRVAAVVSVRDLVASTTDDVESDDAEPGPSERTGLLFVSRQGYIKRTPLALFKNIRIAGLIAASVDEGDALFSVSLVEDPTCEVMLLSKKGSCIRFKLAELRDLGRNARGVKGMDLGDDDQVVEALLVPPNTAAAASEPGEVAEGAAEVSVAEVAAEGVVDAVEQIATPDSVATPGEEAAESAEEGADEVVVETGESTLLTVTERGYGKRTLFQHYRTQKRNGKGIRSFRATDFTGPVVGAIEVHPGDQVMIATDTGRIIRIAVNEVRLTGRIASGVRLMKLEKSEKIVDITRITDDGEVEEDAAEVTPEVT